MVIQLHMKSILPDLGVELHCLDDCFLIILVGKHVTRVMISRSESGDWGFSYLVIMLEPK